MIICGIDPGKTGALAILHEDNSVEFFDVPRIKAKGKDVPAWYSWSDQWGPALGLAQPDLIVIEEVAARPGQGVTSMFSFGRTLGFAHALAVGCGAGIQTVTPSVWKRKLGLLNSSKDASREKVINLLPSVKPHITLVKHDGRAEAALLAWYGRKYLC